MPSGYYFGTVTSVQVAKQTLAIAFDDGDKLEDVGIKEPGLLFFRGKDGLTCATCAASGADLICEECHIGYHFLCLFPKPQGRAPTIPEGRLRPDWKCHGCSDSKTNVFRNKMLTDPQLAQRCCALCGHLPLEVQHDKSGKASRYGVSQCESCGSVHCWICSGLFLDIDGPYTCYRCIGGIEEYNKVLQTHICKLAIRVDRELDKLKGAGKSNRKRRLNSVDESNIADATFITFGNAMMDHLYALNPTSFPKYCGVLMRLILNRLENNKDVPISPYHVLRIMGCDWRATSELLKRVSNQTIDDLNIHPVLEYPPRAHSTEVVGFLSGDFGEQHPTGDLFKSVLQLINLGEFKVIIFSSSKRNKEVETDLIGDKKIEFISFKKMQQIIMLHVRYTTRVFFT
jgi:hypothetical protein